jgi:hypothetical protein
MNTSSRSRRLARAMLLLGFLVMASGCTLLADEFALLDCSGIATAPAVAADAARP